jgi:hypothetical protein
MKYSTSSGNAKEILVTDSLYLSVLKERNLID